MAGTGAAALAVSSPLRRASTSGSLISVMSMKWTRRPVWLAIFSSSGAHVPGSAADVLIRRRPSFTLASRSVSVGDATVRANRENSTVRWHNRCMMKIVTV